MIRCSSFIIRSYRGAESIRVRQREGKFFELGEVLRRLLTARNLLWNTIRVLSASENEK
jgi:hypothetical protein